MSNLREVNATIVSPIESNGAIPVNLQDQTSESFGLRFYQNANTTTLAAAANVGDTTITVTSTAGFVDRVAVIITSPNGYQYNGHQVGAIAGSVVTLDTPIDRPFANGDPLFNGSHAMNVAGTLASPQSFKWGPVGAVFDVDITRIMGYIQSGTAMDDSTFGGISGGLTNGVVLRQWDNSGSHFINKWNVKTNGDLGLLSFDANDTARAPAGSYGFRFRNTYSGQAKHGVTLRLEENDYLEILVQDGLGALEEFYIMGQGHAVTD